MLISLSISYYSRPKRVERDLRSALVSALCSPSRSPAKGKKTNNNKKLMNERTNERTNKRTNENDFCSAGYSVVRARIASVTQVP